MRVAPRHKLRPAAGDTGDCTPRMAGPFTLDAVQVDAELVQVGCRPVSRYASYNIRCAAFVYR